MYLHRDRVREKNLHYSLHNCSKFKYISVRLSSPVRYFFTYQIFYCNVQCVKTYTQIAMNFFDGLLVIKATKIGE